MSAAGSRGGRVVDVKSVRGTLAAVQGPRPVPLRVLPGAPGRRMIRGVDSPDHGDKQHDYDDKSAGETDDGTPSPDDPSYGNWVYGVDPDRFDAGFDEDEEVRECLPLVSDRDREGDAADQPSDEPERRGLAEDELNTFLTETLKAFADHVVNAIAIAHPPLGAAIKLVDLVSKAGQAVSAVDSDEGPEIDIPIPCGAVTFMFRMPLRGEPGEPGSPITAYIAPGGPLVGALGISPARHAAPEAPVGAEPGPGTDAQGGQPGADEAVRYYGDVAVARMKLDLGGNPPRPELAAQARDEAEKHLRQPLLDKRGSLALVIGYDPAARLCVWARLGEDPSHPWLIKAEVDPRTGDLIIPEQEFA